MPTDIWSTVYDKSFSRLNLSTIACLSAGVPSTAVYLVSPDLIASIAANLIFSGVSKSGSPAPRPIISFPAAFNSRALPVTAIVAEGFILLILSDSSAISLKMYTN